MLGAPGAVNCMMHDAEAEKDDVGEMGVVVLVVVYVLVPVVVW